MADILLINPLQIGLGPMASTRFDPTCIEPAQDRLVHSPQVVPPLGLLYIAAYLRQNGYTVSILDLQQQRLSRQTFARRIALASPRLVGISTLTGLYAGGIQVAQAVKAWNPSVPVVMGGPHVTFSDEDPLRTGYVDVVVRQEGELTTLALVRSLLEGKGGLDAVDGITYSVREAAGEVTIRRNPSRPFIKDLDSLPLPARDLLDLLAYHRPGLMITGRGCPNRCIFCAAGTLSGNCHRPRGAALIVEEMEVLQRTWDISAISMADDMMTALPRRLRDICRRLIVRGFQGRWTCESQADHVSPDTLDLMAAAGCTGIRFVVASGAPDVLQAIGRGVAIEQIERAVSWAREVGLDVECCALIGHHRDTPASIRLTVDFLRHLQETYGASVTWEISTPFPGTFLSRHAVELGVTVLVKNWSEYVSHRAVFETVHLSRSEIQRWYQWATLQADPVAVGPVLETLEERLNVGRDDLIQLIADATLRIPPTMASVWSDVGWS